MSILLVVEDEDEEFAMMKECLESSGCVLLFANCCEDAVATIEQNEVDVVITDLALRSRGLDTEGLDVLSATRGKDPFIPVIIMTAYPTPEAVERAIELDVFDFIDRAERAYDPLEMLRHKVRLALKFRAALKGSRYRAEGAS